MGRNRIPNAQKRAAGTYKKSRDLPGIEVEPPPDIPPCPPHLDDGAKAEWSRLSKELFDMGLLTRLDMATLAGYCQAYSRWVAAEGQIAALGVIVESPSGFPVANPHLSVANKALEQLRFFGSDLGLSPQARTRARVQPPAKARAGDALRAFIADAPVLRIAE